VPQACPASEGRLGSPAGLSPRCSAERLKRSTGRLFAQRLAFSRWVALALLAVLVGCMVPPPPPVPATLHVPSDISAEERAVWAAAAASWNAETGHDVVARITDSDDGCGIYVVRGDQLVGTTKGGWAQVTGPCRAEVMLHPDEMSRQPWRALVAAQHELGHILLNTNDHSADERSVMFEELMGPEQAITPDDVAPVLVRMQGGGE
jgi:hypothetical protein